MKQGNWNGHLVPGMDRASLALGVEGCTGIGWWAMQDWRSAWPPECQLWILANSLASFAGGMQGARQIPHPHNLVLTGASTYVDGFFVDFICWLAKLSFWHTQGWLLEEIFPTMIKKLGILHKVMEWSGGNHTQMGVPQTSGCCWWVNLDVMARFMICLTPQTPAMNLGNSIGKFRRWHSGSQADPISPHDACFPRIHRSLLGSKRRTSIVRRDPSTLLQPGWKGSLGVMTLDYR